MPLVGYPQDPVVDIVQTTYSTPCIHWIPVMSSEFTMRLFIILICFSAEMYFLSCFFYCKRKKEAFRVWILYGHQVLDPNTRLLHLDELADFKLNFLFFANSACPFTKYLLKVSKFESKFESFRLNQITNKNIFVFMP